MKVVKFGGSSVADAEQFSKVKAIINDDDERKVVVVSAAGKSNTEKIKITDLLIKLDDLRLKKADFSEVLNKITDRFLKVKNDLKINFDIESEIKIIEHNLKDCSSDYLISRGEFLTAHLMAAYLGFKFIDAADFMTFVDNEIDMQQTAQKFSKLYLSNERVVIPGFYGIKDRKIQLMQRGGSDISGAILANILDADLYENWTDVSGILMADPRIVSKCKRIDSLTYGELQELSYMGFNVFQEEAVQPVRIKNIPTKILNTNHPHSGGTLVVDTIKRNSKQLITGIAGKKNYTIITVKKYQLNKHLEILQSVLSIFQKHNLIVDAVPSGTDSFRFMLPQNELKGILNVVISELKSNCNLDSVFVNDNIALIAAVSTELSSRPAIAGRIIQFLDKSLINIRLVIQEGSDMKIVFGVSNSDYEKTISNIYNNAVGQ
ncbi:aspartate kinase [Companilactobacillus insicii]|uniref:aspartate kinase n=1 Tax=Companilactobacillus insicii TaxID=1732567 RepID=UPI000F78DD4F|nr:aspartate kinase [Companilactobacillus insicii]